MCSVSMSCRFLCNKICHGSKMISIWSGINAINSINDSLNNVQYAAHTHTRDSADVIMSMKCPYLYVGNTQQIEWNSFDICDGFCVSWIIKWAGPKWQNFQNPKSYYVLSKYFIGFYLILLFFLFFWCFMSFLEFW